MGDTGKPRERLDVPAASIVERKLLVQEPAAPRRAAAKPALAPPPPSALLGRLQQFLPELAAANARTAAQAPEDVQIDQPAEEAEDESDSGEEEEEEEGGGAAAPYVQLDLACGVFDLKDDAAVRAAERALVDGVAVEAYEAGSDSEDDSSSSSSSGSDESEGGSGGERAEEQAKPRKKKRHPGIVEMD